MTAADFVYSLRRIMDPATGAKYAEVLFPIANAAAINRGEKPVDTLGVSAPDPATVEIRLEEPTPYFLELSPIRRRRPSTPPRWRSTANPSPGRATS